MGKSARAMLEALLAGEHDPALLADLARGKMKAKRAQLEEALVGTLKPQHRFMLTEQLVVIDTLDEAIGRVSQGIAWCLDPSPDPGEPAQRAKEPCSNWIRRPFWRCRQVLTGYGRRIRKLRLPCSRSMSATLVPPLAALNAPWSSRPTGRAIWSWSSSGWPWMRQAGFGAITSFSGRRPAGRSF
jgi:hypothetical protein